MTIPNTEIRHGRSQAEVLDLFTLPFNELLFRAHQVHRLYFDPREVQISTLLGIKTGAGPEDCKYCPQSIRYDTGLQPETVMDVEAVIDAAPTARAGGASRFCMAGAWCGPKDRDLDKVIEMIKGVREPATHPSSATRKGFQTSSGRFCTRSR